MKSNKLIAEFMGVKSYEASGYTNYVYSEDNHRTEVDLSYHDSWNWLMPVVEKIECTTIDNDDNSDNFFNVMIEVFECNINGGEICICESGNTKREATYNAVVEFINEHNKNK
tara:strand:+ start:35 stop:373 length:339 start_codon:yes stop_codon:yes gene_type:complete